MKLRLTTGLLASAARLVPVPFLDDLLREKALQLLVSRTLEAHGRTYRSKDVAPLYADPHGCLHGCLIGALLGIFKLAIYPFRKVLVWIMAAKYIARDLSEAVLLGRVMDRVLQEGRLPAGAEAASLRDEAERVRRAFDNALQGTDTRLLRGTLRKAIRSVSGLPRAAMHALRRIRKQPEGTDPTQGLSASDRSKVEAGADRIGAALDTPEMRDFLERFDARFEENLAILESRGS